MTMFEYWLELASKPRYQLSESEDFWVTFYPILLLGGVVFVIIIIIAIVDAVKDKKKKRKTRWIFKKETST